ncbi:AgrD family cyclic lactone autoinducer peptide [Paenibacillus sp. UMB4589-SE434]|nr:cyclic lactone autoinducer peptide [Paenibacillus sp. UMB4589-SE434]
MATSLVMLAQLIVKPASALYIYQGDVPKELLKKEE